MLSSMTISERVLILSTLILNAIQLVACGVVTPPPITATSTSIIVPSLTSVPPSITPTVTPTITCTPTPDFCNSAQGQEKIQVMSQELFTALEPGGPTVFDRILVEQKPAWDEFRQYDHGEIRSAGVIFHETAFGPPSPELGEGVNPAILLVTYGVDKNWELPANDDLVSEVDRIRAVLRQRENYWILGTVDRSQYPTVANAA